MRQVCTVQRHAYKGHAKTQVRPAIARHELLAAQMHREASGNRTSGAASQEEPGPIRRRATPDKECTS
eukprot:6147270-Alexandrium_andersonii.AAC.1